MKALLPIFCRPLGYAILVIALFIPFILAILGKVTDNNLIFYKECTKLLMMAGALMILLALTKNESHQTEQIRIKAMRQAIFLTIIFVFVNMLYRVAIRDTNVVDSTSFLIFMIINVLCLEFGMAKTRIDAIFKR
ncbi:hypothetical protein [Bacteroides sp. 51]|uniref:hypothetical protein n=1 Tax=Bacteroides sp. 51 TaxID=2302938 RepID=UPI0013D4AF05|nr:hypothetical protein [Bacteroides sp. 51]NDV81804.1 hypothetical protein [Bacteroides sp. 51]